MARLRNIITGAVVNVPDEKVGNLTGYESADQAASAPEKASEPDLTGGEKPALSAPPKAGKGSGRDEWAAYAQSLGVEVADGSSRDDIVASVEAK